MMGTEEFVTAVQAVMRGKVLPNATYCTGNVDVPATPAAKRKRKEADHTSSIRDPPLAEGRVMKGIADILDISPGAAAFHKYNMMEKLGVSTNATLLMYAMKHHMIAA